MSSSSTFGSPELVHPGIYVAFYTALYTDFSFLVAFMCSYIFEYTEVFYLQVKQH